MRSGFSVCSAFFGPLKLGLLGLRMTFLLLWGIVSSLLTSLKTLLAAIAYFRQMCLVYAVKSYTDKV